MTTTTNNQLDQLAQFTGTEQVFRHALVPTITFTEGAKYVADQAGAYWLLDEIALAQRFEAAVQPEPFQLWVLTVHEKCRATLVCEDGDGITLYTRAIGFTDFPAPGIRLYLCDGVILLPSEY